MVSVLESHLSLLESEAQACAQFTSAEQAELLGDVIALHLAVYEGLERHLGLNGVVETHRPLVPVFQRWLRTARMIADSARALRGKDHEISGFDDLLRAMNRAKPMAEDFDYFVRLNQQIANGEPRSYKSLEEVADELHCRPQ